MSACAQCGRPTANYTARVCRPCMHQPTRVRQAMTRRGIGVFAVALRAGVSITSVKRAAAGQPCGRAVSVAIGRVLDVPPAVIMLGASE